MTEPQKKNGRSTPPGSRSRSSYQRRRRKPTPILHRLAAKCKRLNWRTLLAVLLALLIVFFLTRCTTGSDKDPGTARARTFTACRLHFQRRRRLPGKHGGPDERMGGRGRI